MKTKLLTFLLSITFLFLFIGSSVVFSGDLQDGLDAYERKDYKTAHKLFLPLAEQGDANAQFMLGGLYIQGKGVLRDFKEVVKWWKLAAEQGYVLAQYGLGEMYHIGKGVPQDSEAAVKWWKLAAEQRHERAQFNLALMHDDSLDCLNSPN